MLKHTVKFENYNGNESTKDLYFNLTRMELLEIQPYLEPKMEIWAATTKGGGERSLTETEMRELLEMVKYLIEHAYGERSSDGERFAKSHEIYLNFSQSAVYDAFLWGLFEEADKAIDFIAGIMPKGFAEMAEGEMEKLRSTTTAELPTTTGGELRAVEIEVPAYIREDREPTQRELANMSKEEIVEAFRRKSQKDSQ